MSQIRDRQNSLTDYVREVRKDRAHGDEDIRDMLRAIQKDRARAIDLYAIDVKALSSPNMLALAQFLSHELRGQLPEAVMQALIAGELGPDLMQALTQRFANANSPEGRLRNAKNSEEARQQASDPSLPQQALRWTQFIQKAQHVPTGLLRERKGSAAPKGVGATLTELLSTHFRASDAAGLRNPKLVERGLLDLSPTQRALLLKAAFGDKLAEQLDALGIRDPLQFVLAGALPGDRALLAEALGMGRAQLLMLLMRAELLKIGGGRNGEMGIGPDLLAALHWAGIGMMGSLAALRGLSREELSTIYRLLREATGGFAKTMKGKRPPVKRDLIHWARTAARKSSDIHLASIDKGKLSPGDAQELICAWYLENMLWQELAHARHKDAGERALRERIREEENEEERRERQRQQDQEQHEEGLEMEYDHRRDDRLMCFWITDYNVDPSDPDSMRRMYVCIDPDSGAILPQLIETLSVSS